PRRRRRGPRGRADRRSRRRCARRRRRGRRRGCSPFIYPTARPAAGRGRLRREPRVEDQIAQIGSAASGSRAMRSSARQYRHAWP
ncbi:MAG: hypothetical protein F4Z25_07185, partial [Chloroflexi bacterium]|nr:hypothetical protein [Chloroflexota bacterium]